MYAIRFYISLVISAFFLWAFLGYYPFGEPIFPEGPQTPFRDTPPPSWAPLTFMPKAAGFMAYSIGGVFATMLCIWLFARMDRDENAGLFDAPKPLADDSLEAVAWMAPLSLLWLGYWFVRLLWTYLSGIDVGTGTIVGLWASGIFFVLILSASISEIIIKQQVTSDS